MRQQTQQEVPEQAAVEPVVKPVPKTPEVNVTKEEIKVRPKPQVVVLVSEAIPAYQEVAAELLKRLPDSTVVELGKTGVESRQQRKLLQLPAYQQFVAVGLEAAREAKAVAGREDEVVFCQVFNYQQYDLIGPRAKGVGALPGSKAMFERWSAMSPSLKRILVLTGTGLEEVIEQARGEAARYGIELLHKEVATDKELLFEYKALAPSIQGLWMLPDNRVLSGRTIRELMAFSVRNGKQVAVFTDEILRLGAVMSVRSRASEIASKVEQRLEQAYRYKQGVPGPDLLLLQQGEIRVNSVAAKRYNMKHMEN